MRTAPADLPVPIREEPAGRRPASTWLPPIENVAKLVVFLGIAAVGALNKDPAVFAFVAVVAMGAGVMIALVGRKRQVLRLSDRPLRVVGGSDRNGVARAVVTAVGEPKHGISKFAAVLTKDAVVMGDDDASVRVDVTERTEVSLNSRGRIIGLWLDGAWLPCRERPVVAWLARTFD